LHTLTNLSKAKLGKILLVTGLNRKEVVDQIPSHISFQEVYNPNFKSGMTSSIQAAVTASSASANGYMICLADQIKIKPKTYSLISPGLVFDIDTMEDLNE